MKWILIILGALVALVVLMFIVGSMQPKSHEASLAFRVGKPDSVVWALIADNAKTPEWVPDMRSVRRLPDRDGKPSYQENFGGFKATTVIAVSEPPRLLVKEILPSGPFYGSWTWQLVADGAETRLIITERGTIENPFFRSMMIFNDNYQSMRGFAAALAQRLGTTAVEETH